MNPLTEQQIRASLVNATKREITQASIPDLAAVRWDRLDYLGWVDVKRPLAAYVVIELDRGLTGMMLRAPGTAGRRARAMCAWCQDVTATDDVTLYVARRAGAEGRQGNTVGTLICTHFECSRNARRMPSATEVGSNDPAARQLVVDRRIASVQKRSRRFVEQLFQ
ncbi:FBP domain-containing protein [Rudaeicoccus suwonensis]|uniref:Treble-clef zinc-finger protein n=1 Tax=Rudaeicoccus suwonensis TaxID=657409 RepID=A0A561E770_9MICO|nr:FBP domain-containing protein [Rudaeicoccus suwonensis]TWE11468.1 treble-clef zinc-finger protein [Rudaeicoccus suwonensis]